MQINDYIEKYRMVLDNGKLRMFDVPKKEQEAVMTFVKSHQSEIVSFLSITATRTRALKDMEEEIQEVLNAEAKKAAQYGLYAKAIKAKAMPEEAIMKIEREYEEVARKHPKAKTYIKAKRWSESSNRWTRAIGKRAVLRLLDGVHWEIVAKDMAKEWRNQIFRDAGGYQTIQSGTQYSLTARNAAGVRVAI